MPAGEQSGIVPQVQGADPGMVAMLEHQAGAEFPALPVCLARRPGEQLPVGQHEAALVEAELQAEVEFEAGDDGFSLGQRGDDFAPPPIGKDHGGGWRKRKVG